MKHHHFTNTNRFATYVAASILALIFSFSCKKKDDPVITNPIIKTGDFFANSNWNDPHVMKQGNTWVMYASASQNFDENIKIYRLESDNGISWKLSPQAPVLERTAGSWDSKSVETPAVVYFMNKYHMFYTGYATKYSDVLDFKIGHAVSDDGISWTKDPSFMLAPTNPRGSVNLDFNQFVVAEPGPVVFNNSIYLYFTAMGGNTTVGTTWQVIGVTIFDGTSWTKPQLALTPDLDRYPRSSYVGYSTPSAVVYNGKVHLYFDIVSDPWKQQAISHAVSADGLSNWTCDAKPLLQRSDFAWTADEIRSPSVVIDKDIMMYFAGNTQTSLGIGLKTFDLSSIK
jgi:predicted GH43/DUF377 family glycosyl hydrolase